MKIKVGPIKLLCELLVTVALAEAAVMFVLPVLTPGLSGSAQSLLDVFLLVLLSAPFIYWRSMAYTRALNQSKKPPVSELRQEGLTFGKAAALTAAAQVLGLLLTLAAVLYVRHGLDQSAAVEFDRGVEGMKSEIAQRLLKPGYGLGGLRASYAVHRAAGLGEQLSATEFKAYVAARNLKTEFPGVRGFGFIERVQRSDLAAFTKRAQSEGVKDFQVRSSGNAPDLLVIKHIEPAEKNVGALGFDVGQESLRRQAAERAIATGQPALTGSIKLVQDQAKTPGFLLYMPVYKERFELTPSNGRPPPLIGLIYTPIVASELLSTTSQAVHSGLSMAIYDGKPEDGGTLIYADDGFGQQAASAEKDSSVAKFSVRSAIQVAGRDLTVAVRSKSVFELAQDRSSIPIAGIGGTLLSFMLALSVWLLAAGRLRAQNLASRMTQDLDRLARVAKHTNNIVAIVNLQGDMLWVNQGFVTLTGHSTEEVIGMPAVNLINRDKTSPETMQLLSEHTRRALLSDARWSYPVQMAGTIGSTWSWSPPRTPMASTPASWRLVPTLPNRS